VDTRWAPPPPLPSAAQPYRPLVPADAPPGARGPAPARPTRPVLTLQKPAGADEPKADRKPDDKPADPKTDRDPPKQLDSGTGQVNKEALFRLDGEADLLRRITDELYNQEIERLKKPSADKEDSRQPERSFFAPPGVEPLVAAGTTYQPKTGSYPGGQMTLEPGYVVHRRLHFEDLNSERYGWEVGIAQPAVSTLLFWKDTVLFPAKLASHIGEWYDTSAGKCLPGSPVPYKLYPEPVDAFGILVGAGAITGTAAILGW
jgi:hypothetical protein